MLPGTTERTPARPFVHAFQWNVPVSPAARHRPRLFQPANQSASRASQPTLTLTLTLIITPLSLSPTLPLSTLFQSCLSRASLARVEPGGWLCDDDCTLSTSDVSPASNFPNNIVRTYGSREEGGKQRFGWYCKSVTHHSVIQYSAVQCSAAGIVVCVQGTRQQYSSYTSIHQPPPLSPNVGSSYRTAGCLTLPLYSQWILSFNHTK